MDSFALVRLDAGTACVRASAACGNSVIHDWVNASHASCGGASCKSMCGWFAVRAARRLVPEKERTPQASINHQRQSETVQSTDQRHPSSHTK
jgi:hypothetical protein